MQRVRLKIKNITKLVLLLIIISLKAIAADISALNFNGDLIGKVIPDGTVVNENNEVIGYMTADGLIYDNQKELIGGVIPQGMAISNNNKILGKINNDGSVTSINNALVGKVLPNGLVVNDSYDVLGAVIPTGLVYNDLGLVVGRVSGDGKYYNLTGENNGFVTVNGDVYGYQGVDGQIALIGKLISSKIVLSSTGKFIGSLAPDGKVINNQKKMLGKIHANGYVFNEEGNAIGKVVKEGYAFNNNGAYIGIVSYNGDIINKGIIIAKAISGNRVINKEGQRIGFTLSSMTTANNLKGEYLGRLSAKGEILRKRNVVGKIGANGNIVNEKGELIGTINYAGPIFDYLGNLKANASINGKVYSLEGIEVGLIREKEGFDNAGKVIGSLLDESVCFNNTNEFIGISGIGTKLEKNGKIYKISPNGYVFDEKGTIGGGTVKFGEIYTAEGTPLTYISDNGNTETSSLNEIAKITNGGLYIDKNNKLLGKQIQGKYVTNFAGETQGYTGKSNFVVNDENKVYGKILPNNDVVGISERFSQNYGKADNKNLSISINGDYLGSSTLEGKIVNGNEIVGKISSNGYVVDNTGALYGKTVNYGSIISPKCEVLGVVSDNGEGRTSQGAYLGMILANKQVLSDTETLVGYVVEPQVINGKEGKVIGISSPIGNTLTYNNENLGCIDWQGKVRNSQGEIVGQTIPSMSIMGYDNKIVGYTTFGGKIIDNSGLEIGYMDINGEIKSKDGKNIGVPFLYTVAFDFNNTYLGRINTEGQVVSDQGVILGNTQYNGLVKSSNGNIGYALYDLYVYDNEGKTIGYISKNGKVYSILGEIQGTIYQGFVLDKKQNLIGRGLRDYNIRDKQYNIIGELKLDGRVINIQNIEVGKLGEDGQILNARGEVIAIAEKLQYYQKPKIVAPKSEVEIQEKKKDNITDTEIRTEEAKETKETEENNTLAEKKEEVITPAEQIRDSEKVIGIAVTPGGRYIGDIYSDNSVIDEEGKIIGKKNEKGEIIDNKGQNIGIIEQKEYQTTKDINPNRRAQISAGTTIDPYNIGNSITNVGPGGGIGPGGRYNPRRAAILSQLQEERRRTMVAAKINPGYDAASYTGWQDNWGIGRTISTLRVNMDNMITGDKPIPAVLARSLISLGEAPVTAIVERNIYGDSGRNVIIPAGSRIIGGLQAAEGRSRFDGTSGGVKMDIAWERIIRPDGIAFLLSPGRTRTGDAQGRGGGALGYVDEQLVKKYTLPIVGTMVASAVTYMMAADEDSTGEVETSKQQAASDARQQFMEKMDQILQEIIDSKSQIEPVTFIPAGTRVIIYPMQDLWLRSTKEIEKGISATGIDGGRGGLVNETYYGSGGGTTTIDGNNSQGSQKVILGNQGQNTNSNEGGGTPLINEGPSNNQPQKPNKNIGAIPPPTADGTEIQEPRSEDELSEELELSF